MGGRYRYDDEEDIDVHIGRRGRSPVYAEPVYAEPVYRPAPRPAYYERRSGELLDISAVRGGRSRSRERRPAAPAQASAAAPIVINNRIYNDHEDDYEAERDYLPVASPARRRSRSRRRSSPQQALPEPGYMTREDYELERTRRELERYKLQAQREEDEKLLKKEIELKRLKEEKRAEEEKRKAKEDAERAVKEFKAKEAAEKERQIRAKEDAERAVKEFKAKEAAEKEKERIAKEEFEKEYQRRLADDLRKANMDDRQIAVILKKEKETEVDRPTYTRMARRYLSIETLNAYRIDYTFDTDPEYILIKRWVPEYEQDFLWNHTKEIRERRRAPVVLAIEEKKKKKHHDHLLEADYEIVRREKHKRSKSPGGMITFFAGAGKR